jgi:hypothetical protein
MKVVLTRENCTMLVKTPLVLGDGSIVIGWQLSSNGKTILREF